ncbi:hypothetical protein E2542_SST07326 [Spatholobus suberectus]|nr:hypothetical protein E2542_SST07326 [Spatholobus suberectus]
MLNLVDLAGSKRAAKTGVEGVRLKEARICLPPQFSRTHHQHGKPIRRRISTKQEKLPESNSEKEFGGFSILADDDHLEQGPPPPPKVPRKSKESDLFEPTLLTKEAMDDINKMFNMPLNF